MGLQNRSTVGDPHKTLESVRYCWGYKHIILSTNKTNGLYSRLQDINTTAYLGVKIDKDDSQR